MNSLLPSKIRSKKYLLAHSAKYFFALYALLVFSPAARALTPKADVTFGYSRLGNNTFASGAGSLNGWEGALNVKVRQFVGIEGDIARYGMGASASTPHSTLVLFGPRVTVGTAGVHLFVHALGGGVHSSNNTGLSQGGLAAALGGGGDLRIFPGFALRLSADYLNGSSHVPASSSHSRMTAGIVFRF